jgi:alkylation response protein AidB-like acyl-CoA dehydrogenase
LRGSGSKGIKVNDVFVPWHRVLPLAAAKKNNTPLGGEYDPQEPVYRVPFMPAFTLGFGAISLGGMQRLQKELHTRIRARQRVLLGGQEWESPVAQRNFGEVVTQIEQAEALHERYIKQLEDWCAEGKTACTPQEENRLGAWRSIDLPEQVCKSAFARWNCLVVPQHIKAISLRCLRATWSWCHYK